MLTKPLENRINELVASRAESVAKIPSPSDNPNGLHGRYIVSKASGEPCDPRAVYFVLRLDDHGNDPDHIAACRSAAREYAANAPAHLKQMADELRELVELMEKRS